MLDQDITNIENLTVHVNLLNEDVKVIVAVKSEKVDINLFKITEDNIVPKSENWEFAPGDIVECRFEKLKSGTYFVAYKKY